MKVQVCSDLHLERAEFLLENTHKADVLVLSGDILGAKFLEGRKPYDPTDSPLFQRFDAFMRNVSLNFAEVVYVAGNHEYYGYKWRKTIQVLREYTSFFKNIHFLEQDSIWLDDVKFIGGVLWTDLNKGDPLTLHAIRDVMNDFRVIVDEDRGFTKLKPFTTTEYHKETLKYFAQSLVGVEKAVVCTHHAPSAKSVCKQYTEQYVTNGAYFSDLSEFILDHPQIKLWTHGHMHDAVDYQIGDTRVVCNPRGYVGYETCANSYTGLEAVVEI